MIPTLLCILFFGHSNATGYCASNIKDSVNIYTCQTGFQKVQGGSAACYVLSVLGKEYGGAELAKSGSVLREINETNAFKLLDSLNKYGHVVALVGLVGFTEYWYPSHLETLGADIDTFAGHCRKHLGYYVPCYISAPEIGCKQLSNPLCVHRTPEYVYQMYSSKDAIICKTIPDSLYCDDHHYNADGYLYFSNNIKSLLSKYYKTK